MRQSPPDELAAKPLSETGRACLEIAAKAALRTSNAGWTADTTYAGPYFHTGTIDALVRRGFLKVSVSTRHGSRRCRIAFVTKAGRARMAQEAVEAAAAQQGAAA